jgi:UDP-N-acetylmuramate--alanine ligase
MGANGKMGRKYEKNREFFSGRELIEIVENPSSHLHFVGVGGVSVYSLATMRLADGASVSGSDRQPSERTEKLSALGARIDIGHSPENVDGASLVVYSQAISQGNPELKSAAQQGIPAISRAEYLGIIMRKYTTRIGVSGSHGKSTVTAMLDAIFSAAGLCPTVLSGAELPSGEPFRLGSKDYMIYEACEYRDSFLSFLPTVSLGLNLELDHTDYFADLDSIKASFVKALGRAKDKAVINYDDENLRSVLPKIKAPTVTFGQREGSTYRYEITSFLEGGFEFSLKKYDNVIGIFKLNLPGVFNVANAAAAATVALECGIKTEIIQRALADFGGISRRLELIGRRWGRDIYYDYAHHPTEISAAITALKSLKAEPITVVFKPHTYTRTRDLWAGLTESLSMADYLILGDIFPAREEPLPDITSARLAAEIPGAIYCPDDEILRAINLLTRGTVVLMGAGDLDKVKNEILNK